MLLHQGAAAFTLWTGQPAPLEVMGAALDAARAGGVALGRGRAGGDRAPTPTAARATAGAAATWTASGSSRPARATARCSAPSSRACPAGLALTEDDLAVDLARRQRGYGRGARQAIEHDRARILSGVRHGRTLGSPILLEVDNRDWANWTRVMQVEPLSDEEAAELADARRRRQQARPADHPRPARARGPRRRAQVRLQRRAQRARALVGARDDGAGRRRAASRGRSCASSGSRSGRSRPRSAAWRSTRRARRGRATRPTPPRCAARTPTPRRAMIARIDEARSNGDTVGGVFEVVVHGAPIGLGSLRPLGPAPGRGARRRRDEHQHRQGRGDRARVRADAPLRVAGPRRDRGAARGRDVDPPLEQRRRPDRRRHQRRADRRARRGEADLDAGAAAADRGPRDRRARREGALRAQRHLASCRRRA